MDAQVLRKRLRRSWNVLALFEIRITVGSHSSITTGTSLTGITGGFWDFTSNMASKDMAYTDLALDVHTDTNYFTDSAGLQMFHLLEHVGEGGASQLVDGFKAAEKLKNEAPEAYMRLSLTKMMFHASGNEGLSIQPQTAFPTLVHDETTQTLQQIRWNSSDRGAVLIDPFELPEEVNHWYTAMRFEHEEV